MLAVLTQFKKTFGTKNTTNFHVVGASHAKKHSIVVVVVVVIVVVDC